MNDHVTGQGCDLLGGWALGFLRPALAPAGWLHWGFHSMYATGWLHLGVLLPVLDSMLGSVRACVLLLYYDGLMSTD